MSRGKRGAKEARGTRQGKPLSDLDREVIRQTQLVTQNKAETARRCGITRKTVDTVLKRDVEEDVAIREARRQSTLAIVGKVHGKVDQILDSIGPKDLESGYIDTLDAGGKLINRKQWGPSLLQKVTAGAIFADKLPVLAQYEAAISQDYDSGATLLPKDYDALISGIRQKVKSLTVLNVQFAEDNPNLTQRTAEVLAEAEIVAEAEVIDFDNPGVPDATADGVSSECIGAAHQPSDNDRPGNGEG